MDFFKWKDSFSIGIKEIDHQHRKFLEYLNECYNSLLSNNKTQLDPIMISKLKGYAATHFRFEEDLMTAYGYPKYDQHIRQHKYFVAQIAKLGSIQGSNPDKATEGLFALLRDWFLNHILKVDKEFAIYIS